jgi:putative hemolysin
MTVLVLATLFACGGDDVPPPYDERTPIGPANPASLYCMRLGFTLVESDGGLSECRFSSSESCEAWTFYEGRCGAAHTACARQGGTLETVVADAGTWQRVHSVCRLPNGTGRRTRCSSSHRRTGSRRSRGPTCRTHRLAMHFARSPSATSRPSPSDAGTHPTRSMLPNGTFQERHSPNGYA